ncbi:MAG: sugar O-acetyltransferase [Candidatus Omnitrophica bacterium]|nr:sugar O-acetyltransferase [Candidatus Omnitrophota bacterium]MCB9721875.1 sugar O-acetyltransferase [Candidatus Omnitrophota bacterium]
MSNEFQKMTSGELYDPMNPELVRMRHEARVVIDQLNESSQDITAGDRLSLCKRLFGKMGDNLWLQPPFYCDYGRNIELGEHVYFNFNCVVLDVAKVSIGSHVLIGPNAQLYTATHPHDWKERLNGKEYAKPIVIEDHVWIGGGAIICPGVTVGKRSIIGAGAVVTKDVPDDTVVAGNPAIVIRKFN